MNIQSRWERTVPTLLDRLVENSSATSGGGDMFVSPQRYLETVKRDLLWLLKTEVQRASEISLDDAGSPHARRCRSADSGDLFETKFLANYPYASNSVLAFGIPKARTELLA